MTAVRLKKGLNLVSSLVGNRQFLSALRSSAGQYFSSVGSAHSLSEPVLIFSLTIRRLIRSFHDIPQLLRPAKLGTLSVNAKMFGEIIRRCMCLLLLEKSKLFPYFNFTSYLLLVCATYQNYCSACCWQHAAPRPPSLVRLPAGQKPNWTNL